MYKAEKDKLAEKLHDIIDERKEDVKAGIKFEKIMGNLTIHNVLTPVSSMYYC